MYGLNPLETKFLERKQKSVYFSHQETLEALRQAIMAELDAINMYEQFAQSMRDEHYRKILLEIARERYTAIGILLGMLIRLEPIVGQKIREGVKTFEKRLGVHIEL